MEPKEEGKINEKCHGRTMNVEEYKQHVAVFERTNKDRISKNVGQESRMLAFKGTRLKQRYWSGVLDRLFAMVDHLHESAGVPRTKSPVVVIGDTTMGSMNGHQTVLSKWIVSFLSRFFTVITLNEHNTSQKCCKCLGQLEQFGSGVRLKQCNSDTCQNNNRPFIVNRDINAPMNMTTILVSLLVHGKRPRAFMRKAKPIPT